MRPAVEALARECSRAYLSLRGDVGSAAAGSALGFDGYDAQSMACSTRLRVERAAICGVSFGGLSRCASRRSGGPTRAARWCSRRPRAGAAADPPERLPATRRGCFGARVRGRRRPSGSGPKSALRSRSRRLRRRFVARQGLRTAASPCSRRAWRGADPDDATARFRRGLRSRQRSDAHHHRRAPSITSFRSSEHARRTAALIRRMRVTSCSNERATSVYDHEAGARSPHRADSLTGLSFMPDSRLMAGRRNRRAGGTRSKRCSTSRRGRADGLRAAVVFGHPHPQVRRHDAHEGGLSGRKALTRIGCAVLRFNFRGVGGSEGTFGRGPGEMDDFRAALDFMADALSRARAVGGGLLVRRRGSRLTVRRRGRSGLRAHRHRAAGRRYDFGVGRRTEHEAEVLHPGRARRDLSAKDDARVLRAGCGAERARGDRRRRPSVRRQGAGSRRRDRGSAGDC